MHAALKRLGNSLFASALIAFLVDIAAAQGPIASPIVKGSHRIELQTVATNLAAPHYLTHANDGSGRLFVVDQAGDIVVIKNGMQQATPYFSTASLLTPLGLFGTGNPFTDYDERGLLGLAFHPDFSTENSAGFGKFYTHTSEVVSGPADFTVPLSPGVLPDHQGVIREWTVNPLADIVAPSSSRELLRVDQPQFNHNGGALVFGPDRNLYLGFGDGGQARDVGEGHGASGNGQNLDTVHGSILRIDPLGNNSANGQYGVPQDNPFVSASGIDEIYAYGLRNPFQFSFDVDPATGMVGQSFSGNLIVADVGQSNVEEINVVGRGDNLGWNYKEGSFFYDPLTNTVSETPFGSISLPPSFSPVDPILEYDHDEGSSIAGGFVYNGSELTGLQGKYIFGDFTAGGFFTPGGRLFVGDLTTGSIEELRIGLDDRELGMFVKGFGRGADGEIYLLAGTNLGPFRDSSGAGYGSVFKLVNAVPEPNAAVLLTIGGAIGGLWSRRRKTHTSI